MLKNVGSLEAAGKEKFKSVEPEIRSELIFSQNDLVAATIATLIIVAGTEGAGKGKLVDRLNKWLDGRDVETHAFWDETDDEQQRPWIWRFWKRLPQRGKIAIMFGGWYWDPIYNHALHKIPKSELEKRTGRIKQLEQMLHQDGLLIIKLWFDLTPPKYELRMKKRREVTKHIRSYIEKQKVQPTYKTFMKASNEILEMTHTPECPWIRIEADNKWVRDISVAQVLISKMREKLGKGQQKKSSKSTSNTISAGTSQINLLDSININSTISREKYSQKFDRYKMQLQELSWRAYDARRSTVIVFEGWDAAGKGGTIRRLTDTIDARLYRLKSIMAPTDEELAHHYLWRFWRHVPRDGYMTLYDRSWYGRVLVERVENLASKNEWNRAYQEILDFEEKLTDHGTVLIKFWLHISPEEQLKRFDERKNTPWKRHKITEEDWRNRDKWDQYHHAVSDMINRTNTPNAPWKIIPANDKFYARIEVIKYVIQVLEDALKI